MYNVIVWKITQPMAISFQFYTFLAFVILYEQHLFVTDMELVVEQEEGDLPEKVLVWMRGFYWI